MAYDRSFQSLGSRVVDLEAAWQDRLLDAESLMKAERFPMAIAIGLYSLEILLKTKIGRLLRLQQLPKPFEIHDLAGLMNLSGLSETLNKKEFRSVKTNFTRITKEYPSPSQSRYLPNSANSKEDAEIFFGLLNNSTDGIITWISRQN